MKTLLIIMLILFFNGCSQKPLIVEKVKLICVEQYTLEKIEPLYISINRDDLELFEAKRDSINSQIDFYIEQVEQNNKLCKEFAK